MLSSRDEYDMMECFSYVNSKILSHQTNTIYHQVHQVRWQGHKKRKERAIFLSQWANWVWISLLFLVFSLIYCHSHFSFYVHAFYLSVILSKKRWIDGVRVKMAPVSNINRTGYFRTMANVFWANFEIQNAKFRWYLKSSLR